MPWDVEVLHARINAALQQSPSRIEVAFEPELGIPVWFAVNGSDSEAILVEEFHEVAFAATPYDGQWRFTGDEVDGEEFDNPTTGLIVATLLNGYLDFRIDCNEAGGPTDIHGSFFGIGPVFMTAVGCGENSVLRLVPLEQPERRGELSLTAAGETLVIEADLGELAAVLTISAGGDARAGRHPGRSAQYTLTAVDPGSDLDSAWSRWEGEFEVPAPPSGPQEIVMPDDIWVGDYQLCSPYRSENLFCYDLLVRPASAPWNVTAGADGVVLHDADGTSQTVWEEATRIAFWFDELLLVESEPGIVTTIRDSSPPLELAGEGSLLRDAGRIGDPVVALIARGGDTLLVEPIGGMRPASDRRQTRVASLVASSFFDLPPIGSRRGPASMAPSCGSSTSTRWR